ncbi:2OG-Fe(II) oxygenase family protein [Polaromonas sp. P1-6]|nr:2OG-Fe(II) oxygenase family protein [Polaromonas sp. P1-6]UUZ68465.1 2OG-Fe(II) oxygenase family protein [Polaromonas sp. P2-4]
MGKDSRRWSEASEVIPMFPSLVWKTEIESGLRDAMRVRILEALADMRQGAAPLEVGQGWQSVQDLHQHEAMRELVACINHCAAGVLRFLRIGTTDYEITGCWATVLAPGASHKLHSHPNNFLSGVYYVRTGEGADTINFHDPRKQASVIRPPVTELTAENTDQVVVRVREGTLLLFPAYLEHSVDANGSADERVSISFNLMFSSFAQRLSKPLW